jgi:hypothetical protein
MKATVITTTINLPRVVEVHARVAPDVSIIIAGDRKSPHDEIKAFFKEMENVTYLDVDAQICMNLKCSDIIGWNSIQRRNVALLAAIAENPDIIITIDDDNYPCAGDYLDDFKRLLSTPFTGLAGTTHGELFDVGQLFKPSFHHRGFPYDTREEAAEIVFTPVVNAKVGVAAGLWLGDPDIDAATRLVNRPLVKELTDIARQGVVVRPENLTVFNSQNTAFLTELAPLMMVWPGTGRYDDIWASYFAQRIMREDGWHIHFGAPLVWQQRNPQNLIGNLKAEIMGMETTPRLLADLEELDLTGSTVVDKMASAWRQMRKLDYLPAQALDGGAAWCEDVMAALDR